MNILVWISDAFRSANSSTYGYSRETTPNLTELANDGNWYRGVSPATWTLPAAGSILSGLRPYAHGTLKMDQAFPDIPTIPQVLPDSYTKAFVTAAGYASSEFGFDRGFDYFNEVTVDAEDRWAASINETSAAITKSFESISNERFFLLAWSIGPHWPYSTEGQWGSTEVRSEASFSAALSNHLKEDLVSTYDDQIRHEDSKFGAFLSELHERNLYDDTLIIFVSDHGEGFNEGLGAGKNLRGHRGITYQELVDIPFVVKPPQQTDTLLPSGNLASLIDIAPTIVDATNSSNTDIMQGKSLCSTSSRKRAVVQAIGRLEQRYEGVRTSTHNYIRVRASDSHLTNLKTNPMEHLSSLWKSGEYLTNTEGSRSEALNHEAVGELKEWLNSTIQEDKQISTQWKSVNSSITDERRNLLQELGYID